MSFENNYPYVFSFKELIFMYEQKIYILVFNKVKILKMLILNMNSFNQLLP